MYGTEGDAVLARLVPHGNVPALHQDLNRMAFEVFMVLLMYDDDGAAADAVLAEGAEHDGGG